MEGIEKFDQRILNLCQGISLELSELKFKNENQYLQFRGHHKVNRCREKIELENNKKKILLNHEISLFYPNSTRNGRK